VIKHKIALAFQLGRPRNYPILLICGDWALFILIRMTAFGIQWYTANDSEKVSKEIDKIAVGFTEKSR
jgi:hypothetical protein